MPIRYINVPAEPVIIYKGITIYHTYKDNYEDGILTYWFTTDTEDDYYSDDAFDIRELSEYRHELTVSTILANAIDNETITKNGLTTTSV